MPLFTRLKHRYIYQPILDRAVAFWEKGQLNLAIRVLEEGLDINPAYAPLLWMRAELAIEVGDLQGALLCLADLERTNSMSLGADFYELKGNILKRLELNREAIQAFSRAIEVGTPPPELFYKRGKLYIALAQYESALQDLLHIENSDQHFPGLSAEIAFTYFKLRRFRSASVYFRRAAAKGKLTEQELTTLGEAYMALRAYDKAIIVFSNLIQRFEKSIEGMLLRASCYLMLKNGEKALEDLDQIIAIRTDMPEAFIHRAFAHLLLNQPEAAKVDLDQVAGLRPQHALFYRNMAFYFLLINQAEKALRQLEKAIIINEKIPLFHFFKGWALAELGAEKEAQFAYLASKRLGEWTSLSDS